MVRQAAQVFAGKRAKVTEVWERRGDRAYMLLGDSKILKMKSKPPTVSPGMPKLQLELGKGQRKLKSSDK